MNSQEQKNFEAQLIKIARALGTPVTRIGGEGETIYGRQASGSCGVWGLRYNDFGTLCHEFVHLLQNVDGRPQAHQLDDGWWVLGAAAAAAGINAQHAHEWAEGIVPALLAVGYTRGQLCIELPAWLIEAYAWREETVEFLIMWGEQALERRASSPPDADE